MIILIAHNSGEFTRIWSKMFPTKFTPVWPNINSERRSRWKWDLMGLKPLADYTLHARTLRNMQNLNDRVLIEVGRSQDKNRTELSKRRAKNTSNTVDWTCLIDIGNGCLSVELWRRWKKCVTHIFNDVISGCNLYPIQLSVSFFCEHIASSDE